MTETFDEYQSAATRAAMRGAQPMARARAATVAFSPHDNGWYATVFDAATGREVASIPPGEGVLATRSEVLDRLRSKYGDITILSTD